MGYFNVTTSYIQHVFNTLKHLQKCFANVLQHYLQMFQRKSFAKHFYMWLRLK